MERKKGQQGQAREWSVALGMHHAVRGLWRMQREKRPSLCLEEDEKEEWRQRERERERMKRGENAQRREVWMINP